MTQEKQKRIHPVYGCIAAVLIAALGIALILSCLHIYNSGAHPYSTESIGKAFQKIAALVYVVAAIVAGGFVLDLVLPLKQKRPKAWRDEAVVLAKLRGKAGALTPEQVAMAKKEPSFRLAMRIITAFLFVALMIYPAIYFSNPAHFSIADLSRDIIKAVLISLVPAAVGLLLCYFCCLLATASIRRETEFYKNLIAANKSASPAPVKETNCRKTVLIIRCVILAVAVCFIVIGFQNGGMKDVFDKAVAICTECIGLG